MRLAAAVGVVALGLGGVACQGDNSGGTPGTRTTVVLAGEPVPLSQLTGALEGLCEARRQAQANPRAAEATFYDKSHATLHTVARGVEDVDRPAAANLLEAMQQVEAALAGGLASGGRVAADLDRLVDVTRAGLARLEVETHPCDK